MSFVAMVVKAVLDGSEGRGPNEKVRRDFEERWERLSGVCGIAVGTLVGGLVLELCQSDSEASVAMERHVAEFLFDLGFSVGQRLLVQGEVRCGRISKATTARSQGAESAEEGADGLVIEVVKWGHAGASARANCRACCVSREFFWCW